MNETGWRRLALVADKTEFRDWPVETVLAVPARFAQELVAVLFSWVESGELGQRRWEHGGLQLTVGVAVPDDLVAASGAVQIEVEFRSLLSSGSHRMLIDPTVADEFIRDFSAMR